MILFSLFLGKKTNKQTNKKRNCKRELEMYLRGGTIGQTNVFYEVAWPACAALCNLQLLLHFVDDNDNLMLHIVFLSCEHEILHLEKVRSLVTENVFWKSDVAWKNRHKGDRLQPLIKSVEISSKVEIQCSQRWILSIFHLLSPLNIDQCHDLPINFSNGNKT